MPLTKNILLAVVLTISPMLALAHPGHDHSSAWSLLIHLLWVAPIIAVGAFILFKRNNVTLSKQGNNNA